MLSPTTVVRNRTGDGENNFTLTALEVYYNG